MIRIISAQTLFDTLINGVFTLPERQPDYCFPLRKLPQARAFSLIGDYAMIYRFDIDLVEDLVEEGVNIEPVEFAELELQPGDECLVVHTVNNRRLWYLLSLT